MRYLNCEPLVACALLFSAALWSTVDGFSLVSGDIGTINFWVDDYSNGCAFVSLVNIPAFEHIAFTTNAWDEVDSAFDPSIGSTLVWTAPEDGLEAGSVVSLETFFNASKVTTNASVGTISGGSLQFQVEGDQIHAYQGTRDIPTFVFALNFAGAGWNSAAETVPHGSYQPPGVENASLSLLPFDSYAFEGPRSGTRDSLLLAMTDSSYWTPYNGKEGPRFDSLDVFDVADVITRVPSTPCNLVCFLFNSALYIFDFFAS